MTNESDSSKKPPAEEPEPVNENTSGDTFNLPGDYRGANIYIKSTIYGSTGNNVRLQNLRDFTVQIRAAESEIGYYWDKVDAEEVLAVMASP